MFPIALSAGKTIQNNRIEADCPGLSSGGRAGMLPDDIAGAPSSAKTSNSPDGMRKKSSQGAGIAIAVVLLLLAVFFLNYLYLWDGFFKSNYSIGWEANSGIKHLALDVIKDQHLLFKAEPGRLYTSEYCSEHAPDDELSAYEQGIIIVVNHDFMDSVVLTGDGEYTVRVKQEIPEDWCYYLTIKEEYGRYLVSDIEIDP